MSDASWMRAAAFSGMWLAALAAPAAAGNGLEAFRWKARPVMVFAPKGDDARARDQISRLTKDRAALDSREMPVFVVAGDRVTTLDGGQAPAALTASGLRRAYGVNAGAFAMILVGKDGGEKFRTADPVAAGRLIALVDTMPMRKNEAR